VHDCRNLAGGVLTLMRTLNYRGSGAKCIFESEETHMRKLALLLAVVLAATSPSLAFAAKKHHHHKMTTTEPADPNADTSHLIHDLFMGK
jgi:hypothetical protein